MRRDARTPRLPPFFHKMSRWSLRAIDTGHQPGTDPEQGTGDPAPQSGDRSDPSEPPADQTRRLFGRRGRKRD